MNRKLHNTFSALSVATVLMTVGLIAATPTPHDEAVAAQPQAVAERATMAKVQSASRAAEVRAKTIEQASLARAKDIEARAEALAKELEGKKDVGEILGRVAGFTAEVATEAALNAAIEEFTSVDTAEAHVAPPAPVRKPRQNRRSLAMPYFSFATRG